MHVRKHIIIYKYYRISTQALNMLLRNEIFLAHPSMFNDPLDSMINAHGNDEYALNLISDFLVQNLDSSLAGHGEISDLIVRWGDWDVKKGPSTPAFSDSLKYFSIEFPELYLQFKEYVLAQNSPLVSFLKDYITIVDQIGICSFSRLYDSESLWAYYADNHRGICVEYEIHENKTSEYRIGDVVYLPSAKYSMMNNFEKSDLTNQAFFKNESWKLEEEVRLVSSEITRKCVKFPGEIKAISFGMLTPKHDEDIIERLFGRRTGTRLMKMRLDHETKRLTRVNFFPEL